MYTKIDINTYFIRPTSGNWAIYRSLGINKARPIYIGTEIECQEHLKKLRLRIQDINETQYKNPNYIFNLMMESMQRVTELKADLINNEIIEDSGEYDFTSENEMFRDWCDEYEFEYKLIEDPEDEDFLESSENFFKVKLKEVYGKR